jgi:hypothetical protein
MVFKKKKKEDLFKLPTSPAVQPTSPANSLLAPKPNIFQQQQSQVPPKDTTQETLRGNIKEKGGYIDSQTGQFVPPKKGTTTEINFNKDGSVDYTPVGGETVKLTREEYKGLLGQEKGITTERTKEIQGVEAGGLEEIKKQQFQEGINIPTQNRLDIENQSGDLRGTALGDTLAMVAKPVVQFSNFLPEFLKFGTKKSLRVQKAETAFSDWDSVLGEKIEGYKMGAVSQTEIQTIFDNAQASIEQLHRETKGAGQADLRFWVDEGAEIEAQVEKQIAQLNSRKAQLGLI